MDTFIQIYYIISFPVVQEFKSITARDARMNIAAAAGAENEKGLEIKEDETENVHISQGKIRNSTKAITEAKTPASSLESQKKGRLILSFFIYGKS